ncbi:MAG: MarR family 2-MHQ and catechol resistance regulon transcriptional repressor [Crocinitomicaceae bacterium]|jgi:MarR family 2-MHQ and catechol resistance regulon transcriptional repressor
MKIDEAIQSKFTSSIHRAIVNVNYTSNYLTAKQNNFMNQFGLSMPQFNILRILRGSNKAISVNTIKDRMVEKSPNTTRLMDKLLDKGLIERERCEEDRRVVYVKISQKGLELLVVIDNVFQNEDQNSDMIPTSLSEEEAEQLSSLLDKIRG